MTKAQNPKRFEKNGFEHLVIGILQLFRI